MVTIQKDDDKKIVTQGAYEDYYEHLGYTIVHSDNKSTKKEVKKEIKYTDKIKDKNKLDNYSRK